ncbi:LysR substrate-binding domain-containing protein [Streptomyces sp. NPDC007905]|uniref:LysR substrate-binding domain-containing protein n=1 Tax=Streptomyces sp. NPDC007905 TaxID=3364788 RepID=UPI0036E4608B
MELRQLQYFVAVAEEEHFGRAARRLFVGQPAVSQQIRRLERALHVELFDRSPRRVRLTKAGERFLPEARAVLAAADQARQVALGEGAKQRPALRLGTCSGLGDNLHRVLNNLATRLPEAVVDLIATSADARVESVASGRLDAAFTHDPEPGHPAVRCIDLWREPLVVALPASHPLAARKEIALRDLEHVPLRLLPRRSNPVLVDLVVGACAATGFTPVPGPPSSTTLDETLASIGASAPSWTVLYASHARLLNSKYVAFRPFAEQGMEINTMLLVRREETSPEIEGLLDACRIQS